MWVESDVGHGTTFHFTTQMKAVPSRGRVRFRGEQPALVGRRLLVVDDNDTNRRILTLQAESWGMQTQAVASGREALALIEESVRLSEASLAQAAREAEDWQSRAPFGAP